MEIGIKRGERKYDVCKLQGLVFEKKKLNIKRTREERVREGMFIKTPISCTSQT